MSDTVALPIPRCRHCQAAIDFTWWRPPRSQFEQDVYAALRATPGVRRAYSEDCCMICYAEKNGWQKAGDILPTPFALVQIVEMSGWADFGYWGDDAIWHCWNDRPDKAGWREAEGGVVWWRGIEIVAPPTERIS